MLVFDCGYLVQQDDLKPFFKEETDEEYDAFGLMEDIYRWWYRLPRHLRAQMPLPQIYVPDGISSYETGIIWLRTRRVEVQGTEVLKELDVDRAVKKRFEETMGRGFHENFLKFDVKRRDSNPKNSK